MRTNQNGSKFYQKLLFIVNFFHFSYFSICFRLWSGVYLCVYAREFLAPSFHLFHNFFIFLIFFLFLYFSLFSLTFGFLLSFFMPGSYSANTLATMYYYYFFFLQNIIIFLWTAYSAVIGGDGGNGTATTANCERKEHTNVKD